MGLGVADYSLDGSLDILKTHFADDTAVLYKNDGKGNFEDVTNAAGLGVETRYVSWGAGIQDLDNDGNPDLFWVTGSVYPEIERKLPSYPYKGPRIVFRNLGGGKFEELMDEAGPGVSTPHASRGCAFGDFDNDGDVDVIVINMNQPPSLLRNDCPAKNNWLKIKCVGTKSNRSAIGARVRVVTGSHSQLNEVMSGSSYISQNDLRVHFGLGQAKHADLIELRWPLGLVESFKMVEANQLLVLEEGKGIVRREKFVQRHLSL